MWSTTASRTGSAGTSRFRARRSARYISLISSRLLPRARARVASIASLPALRRRRFSSITSSKSRTLIPASSRRCRATSAPVQVQEVYQAFFEMVRRRASYWTGQDAWHEHLHNPEPNSKRSRRGLKPPPAPLRCGQPTCAPRLQAGVWSDSSPISGRPPGIGRLRPASASCKDRHRVLDAFTCWTGCVKRRGSRSRREAAGALDRFRGTPVIPGGGWGAHLSRTGQPLVSRGTSSLTV
jgi:hypothetical protein